MEFGADFFRDEVRNGFYIPAVIKQGWAAELSVLSEIDRICEKHDITYYADWGTFLGAVRHGGFVPWDDDLDICMKRDDYEKFRAVADKELPKEYTIHDYERHEDHWLFLSRVVNNSKMCFEDTYLSEHNNFPWLAGVDIFVKDYLFMDDEKEKKRDKDIMNILAVADGIAEGTISRQNASAHLNEIKKRYHINLPGLYRERDVAVALYGLAEKQMAKVRDSETERIGQIFPWILKFGPDAGEDKKLYEKIIRLPFENTTIPVPAYYNKVLSTRYGNYNEIKKVWTGHDYPFFEGQKEEMERLLGQALPGFTFDKLMLERPEAETSKSLKVTARECVAAVFAMISSAKDAALNGQMEDVSQNLTDAQNLAADLGTLMETVKGEENPHTLKVVKALEDFCESVWQEYQDIAGGEEGGITDGADVLSGSMAALDRVSDAVKADIEDIKEILFLPIGPKEWEGFRTAYEKALQEKDAEVWVIPLPLLKKDYFGNVTMTNEEIEAAVRKDEYPSDLMITDWTVYDFSLHCPDRVYIQNPYDETNPCLTVPPDFHAARMRKYAGEIIFIPFARTGEFGREDVNDLYNLKHYAASPGVICADKVFVQSENIREQYVNCLTNFAGKDTKGHWEKKIGVSVSSADRNTLSTFVPDSDELNGIRKGGGTGKPHNVKKVIFCIGANELMEHSDEIASAVYNRIQIFKDSDAEIKVSVSFYPNDLDQWRRVSSDGSEVIFSVLDKTDAEIITVVPAEADRTAEDYDAYYGSPSPLIPAFVTQKKPVMLANFGI